MTRTTWSPVAALLALGASGCFVFVHHTEDDPHRPIEAGHADAWFDEVPEFDTGGHDIQFEGVVVGLHERSPGVELEIEGDDGERQVLGWEVQNADAIDVTPAFDVDVGQRVHLRWVSHVTWGWSGGFVLQDEQGLVAALEIDTFGPALGGEAVPGLRVRRGPITQRAETPCGLELQRAIVFEADEELVLEPFDRRPLRLDGQEYAALAIAWSAFDPAEVHCADAGHSVVWAVHR